MVNSDLIENITARFQQGEKAAEIKEALINEGWSDGDIEAAFAHIRHDALMHIPIYARIHTWMQSVDQKTAQLPTRTMVQIFIGIGLLFLGGVLLLYYFLDPLGVRTAERDQNREKAAIELRTSLEKYYKDHNGKFPSSVKQLVPTYISAEPLDPRSKKPYEYKSLSNSSHYEFCIEFEMQVIRCISSDNSSPIPDAPEVETATPVQSSQFAINGQVFFDADENGEKEDLEETPEGVVVKISDSTKNVVCDTKTDSSGIFNCNLNGEGLYSVVVTLPAGYTSALGNPIPVALPDSTSVPPNIQTLFIGLVK